MSNNIINNNRLSKKHRPLGVWILTIHALLFAAIILSGDSYFVLRGEVAMYSSAQVPSMLRWAYLNIGIIIASILAWAGWELGRKLFLLLMSVFYLEVVIDLYLQISHQYFKKNPIEHQIDSWFHFIGYILILILYIWYFNKFSTREFYKKN